MCPISTLRAAALLGVLTAEPLRAQTLQGRLLDEDTERPIHSAYVILMDADNKRRDSVFTGASGVFLFRIEHPGRYRVGARRIGYEPTATPPLKLKPGETLMLDFLIASTATKLTPVKVTARRRARVPRLQGLELRTFGARYVSREQIRPALNGARHFGDLLRRQNIPGLQITEDYRGELCVTLPRSRGRCLNLYLDGSPMRGAVVLDPRTIDRMVVINPTEAAMLYGMHAADGILMIYSSRALPQAEEPRLGNEGLALGDERPKRGRGKP